MIKIRLPVGTKISYMNTKDERFTHTIEFDHERNYIEVENSDRAEMIKKLLYRKEN